MSKKRDRSFVKESVQSGTKKEPQVRTISLYRGEDPTRAQLRYRNTNLPIIAVDETGDMGLPEEGSERQSFVVVGALIEDRKRFVKVRDKFPKGKKVKYSTITLKEGRPIFKSLAAQDFVYHGTHRPKEDSCFEDTPSKVESYIEMVSEVIDENDPGKPHDIVIDTPPVEATQELVELYRNKLKKRGVEWFEVKSSSSDPVLQVHDFTTGAVGDVVDEVKDKEELCKLIVGKNRKKK